jgi:hypothetical protein
MGMMNQQHERDCMQATLVNLLGVKYDTIPNFYLNYGMTGDEYNKELDDYLASINRYRILVDVTRREDGKAGIPFYCSLESFRCIGILEKKNRKYAHAVLMQITRRENSYQMEILYDPKINTDYSIEDLIQLELILNK